jgi:hypothetical protein
MHALLGLLFLFAFLTLWVQAFWPIAVFEVGSFLFAAASILRYGQRLLPLPFPLIPLTCAVLWGVFQWLTGRTVYAFDTKLAILRWASFWSIFITGILLFRDERVSRWFRSVMLWFGFLLAVEATIQNFTSPKKIFWMFPTQYDRVMGPILYHNHYAVFIEIVFPIALYYAFRREDRRLLYASMAAVMYASVIVSASRAGAILTTAEFVAVCAALLAHGRIMIRQAGKVFAQIVLIFGVFALVVGWNTLLSRFLASDPMAIRRELDRSSLQMIAARPWFGSGLGTWPTAYPQYALVDVGLFVNQAHSDWLEWTAEGGLPFGILMATLFIWSLRPAFRSVWGIGVVAVLIHAAVDYPFSRPAVGSWAVVLMSMLTHKDIND